MIQARILEQTVWIIPFVKQCFLFYCMTNKQV